MVKLNAKVDCKSLPPPPFKGMVKGAHFCPFVGCFQNDMNRCCATSLCICGTRQHRGAFAVTGFWVQT